MKKITMFLFAAVTAMVLATGTANADRGIWFINSSQGWDTYFNVVNVDGSNAATVTIDFLKMDGTSLGTTTRTLSPNEYWNFSTATAVSTTLTTTLLNTNVRGTVKITETGATSGNYVKGYSTIFNGTAVGFNFRFGPEGTDTINNY